MSNDPIRHEATFLNDSNLVCHSERSEESERMGKSI